MYTKPMMSYPGYLRPLLIISLALTILLFIIPIISLAAPADPRPFQLSQPDGTTFMAREVGDEFAWGYTTADGNYTVTQGADGYWRYVNNDTGAAGPKVGSVKPGIGQSRFLFLSPEERSQMWQERASPSRYGDIEISRVSSDSSFKRYSLLDGATTFNFPIIPVEFSDMEHTYTSTDLGTVFFADHPGIAPYGSVTDYYEEVSYGKWSLAGSASSWVLASLSYDYYAQYEQQMTGSKARELVLDAVSKADAMFDFGSYDNDDDGFVDSVVIVYADSGTADNWPIRPHSWDLVDDYLTNDHNDQGEPLKIRHYIIVSERERRSAGIMTVGVCAHEMGHVFGLPDVYTEWDPQVVGDWDLMATGSWNGVPEYNGNCPAHLSAWNKATLGFITPVKVNGPGMLTVTPAENSPVAFQLLDNPDGYEGTLTSESGTGEFFLVECRRKLGFDRGLPGEGILIWHVNEYNTLWDRRNNYEDSKLLDLEEADDAMYRGDSGDPWANSVSGFTGSTTPDSKLYDGAPSGVAITSISSLSDSMTVYATLSGPAPTPTPVPEGAPNKAWDMTHDTGSNESCFSIKEMPGGGFAMAGYSDTMGNNDMYLVKISADGSLLSNELYGWDSEDIGYSLVVTPSGECLIAGVSDYYGDCDACLIKVRGDGTMEWGKTFGWASEEAGYSMIATSDGYVISGYTDYFGDRDVYLIKTDSAGNVLWEHVYGTSADEEGFAVSQVADGGFIVAGYQDADSTGYDVYIVRTDSGGNQMWAYSYTGSYDEWANAITIVDGGYAIGGEIYDYQTDIDYMNNALMLKIDDDGDVQWSRSFGGSGYDWGSSIIVAEDGGYVMSGSTYSYDKMSDVYVIKTDSNGDTIWTTGVGSYNYEYGWSLIQASDGGYVVGGSLYDRTSGDTDVYAVKLDPETVTPTIMANVSLKPGWNLISLPVVNDTIKASSLAGTGVTMVAAYDHTKGYFDDIYLIGTSPPSMDFNILPDTGYFLLCDRNATITFTGTQPVSRYVDIYPGWNLIGWSNATPSTASIVAGKLAGNQIMARYTANAISPFEIYMEGYSSPAQSFTLKPGEGYYVYSDSTQDQRLYY